MTTCHPSIQHRTPSGPNDDLGICPSCHRPTSVPRPAGETYGWHDRHCGLPIDHPGACNQTGDGHKIPDGHTIRGYWPNTPEWNQEI